MGFKGFSEERVAVLTSGGDSPGMNAVIASLVLAARVEGIDVLVVEDGYRGLVEGRIRQVSTGEVKGHCLEAGSFIGSARYPEFKESEVREGAINRLRELGVGSLVVIGGDGSYQGALALHKQGLRTLAIPATIDNDITSSDFTVGFDSALEVVASSLRSIRATASSHRRIFLVEVMGHGCGDLTLFGGIAGGADLVVTNETKLSGAEIAAAAKSMMEQGRRSVLVLISEFIFPSLSELAREVEGGSGYEVRALALSHLQRGGRPTPSELVRAFEFGMRAVELIRRGESGLALGYQQGRVTSLPIEEALSREREDRSELVKLFNEMAKLG